MDSVIYCDESCHLEHDHIEVMGLGAVKVPQSHIRLVSNQLRDIKARHNARGELKWTKVSMSRLDFYQEVVDWFIESDALSFRTLIVPNKSELNHDAFNDGSHDEFYYKMYFSLLNKMLSPSEHYSIYLDIKDTRSKFKVARLREILCNNVYDFTGEMISKIQHARSHELEIMQLTDFLLGAAVYANRGITSNSAKLHIVKRLSERGGVNMLKSSPLSETKYNIFIWKARSVN